MRSTTWIVLVAALLAACLCAVSATDDGSGFGSAIDWLATYDEALDIARDDVRTTKEGGDG